MRLPSTGEPNSFAGQLSPRQSPSVPLSVVPVVTIFVRHSEDCPRSGDEFYKACKCRKHLRWSYGGRQYRKSAQTRTWSIAEQARRKVETQFESASGDSEVPVSPTLKMNTRATTDQAVELFLTEKRLQGVDATAQRKYERELGRLAAFMGKQSKHFPHEITLQDMTAFRAGWETVYPSSLTRSKVQERLRGFLRYCVNAKMMEPIQLPAIRVTSPPTLPLTDKQYAKLLSAIGAEFTGAKAKRVHALVRFMRHSGLAIQDAVTLERKELQRDERNGIYRVVTSRQKTGTHVSVPLPPDVAEEILSVIPLNGHPDYVFWNRADGKPKAAVDVWERAFKRIFKKAAMPSGHSHQLRDTFAVSLLQKGVPMEEVSKLLGHTSIKTTEKSYAPWVTSRQDRLDSLVVATWEHSTPIQDAL